MSTISDWDAVGTGINLNDPLDGDSIAYPADGVSDLGFVLRCIGRHLIHRRNQRVDLACIVEVSALWAIAQKHTHVAINT